MISTSKQELKLSFPAVSKQANTQGTDVPLIRACIKGDQKAWAELVERYARLIYSIPLRYGLSVSDADDVFQNVFTIVYNQLPTLRNQTSLTSWLITITHRESIRFYKRARPCEELDERMEDEHAPPADQAQRWERQHLVHCALDQLNLRCRKLLTALFLTPEPSSYEQLAKQLHIPVGSVGPTRARCFKKLERVLTSMGVNGNF